MVYKIRKLKEHSDIKQKVLGLIADSPGAKTGEITRTDWYTGKGKTKEYFKFLLPILSPYIEKIIGDLGHREGYIETYWFQQYETNSEHPWHTHPICAWSNVYYLEFPKDGPKLEIKMPFSNEIIIPDVEEGDLITFPSNFYHRSPVNKSSNRKTIVAFDMANLK